MKKKTGSVLKGVAIFMAIPDGSYQNINPDKGYETTITFNKDGTLVWTEKYNIFGDKTLTFYGTYHYDKNDSCYYLDVKAGINSFSKDTTFTMVRSSNNHLIIDGGALDHADFKKQ